MKTKQDRYRWLILSGISTIVLLVSLAACNPTPPTSLPERVLSETAIPATNTVLPTPPPPTDTPSPPVIETATPPPLMDTATPAPTVALPNPAWRIGVVEDGIYMLDYDTLAAAGVPVAGANAADFHLIWNGQEVAMHENGNDDAVFEPGEAWVFYGEKPQNTEPGAENVYVLGVYASTPGLRTATHDVTPGPHSDGGACIGRAIAEQDLVNWEHGSDYPGTDSVWFWEEINSPDTVSRAYPITLPASNITHVVLEVDVASANSNDAVDPDHHLQLYLNGDFLGDFYWDGKTGYRITTEVAYDDKLVQNGAGELTVVYVTDVGPQDVYFDRATLIYHHAARAENGVIVCEVAEPAKTYAFAGLPLNAQFFNISDPLHPVALIGVAAGPGDFQVFSDEVPQGTRYRAEVPRPVAITPYTPN